MSRKVSFGILLIPLQALDVVGPVDILGNINHQSISAMISPEEADRLNAPSISFHYIGPSLEPVLTTGNIRIQPTTTLDDCPPLDYLLIGGPDPKYAANLPENMKDFILERSKQVDVIFTTCTGGLVLAATGLLDNIPATVNHLSVPFGKEMSPSTKWDINTHWVVSKREGSGPTFWTAAGAGAGMDMMAHWVKQEFGKELLNLSTSILEWQPRDKDGKPLMHMNGRKEMVDGYSKL